MSRTPVRQHRTVGVSNAPLTNSVLVMPGTTIANIGAGTANDANVKIDGGTSDFNVVPSGGSTGFGLSPQCYNAVERFSLAAFCPGIGWGPNLAPGGTFDPRGWAAA